MAAASPSSRVDSVSTALTSVISLLENEQTLKKSIREALDPVEDVHRSAVAQLNKLHSSPSAQHAEICQQAISTVQSAHAQWAAVAALVPAGEFHRYAYALGPVMRSYVQTIALATFITTDELISAEETGRIIGISQPACTSLQLSAEDYLQGVIGMVNELPRLSINAVTSQNFQLPVRIASFVNDVFASYSLLNLRNDQLRRRFDTLKYDLKRCEDVVYDLTLRGLVAAPKPAA